MDGCGCMALMLFSERCDDFMTPVYHDSSLYQFHDRCYAIVVSPYSLIFSSFPGLNSNLALF